MKRMLVIAVAAISVCGAGSVHAQSTAPVSVADLIFKLDKPGQFREASEKLKMAGEPAVKDLFGTAKNKAKPKGQRVGALILLGEMTRADNGPAKELVARKDIAAFLEKTLTSDPDESLRQAAAIGLGNLGKAGSIPKLKSALSDKSSKVRARAAWALAKLGDKSGKDAAVAALGDKSPGAQAVALEAIGEIGDKNLVPELQKRYDDKNPRTRINARLAVRAIEAKNLQGEAKIKYYEEALDDKQIEVSRWALNGIAEEVETDGPNKEAAVKVLERSAGKRTGADRALEYFRARGKIQRNGTN